MLIGISNLIQSQSCADHPTAHDGVNRDNRVEHGNIKMMFGIDSKKRTN